jgi:hypothetical protein
MPPEARANKIYEEILKMVESQLGSTTTFQHTLQRFGKKLFGPKFAGVFASDKVPKLSKETPYAILNLDKSGEPGSHWVAVVFVKPNNIMVYDSFGRKTKHILPNLESSGNGNIHMTDPDPEQTESQKNCGARSISFILLYHFYGHDMAMLI